MLPVGNSSIPEDLFRTILDKTAICTVDVVFFNKDKSKTLLFKRNNEPVKGIYFTIGGRVFKNEKLIDCAVRQAKRETGLDIDPKKFFARGVLEDIWQNSAFDGVTYHDVDVFYGYVLENETAPIALDNQHREYKWFDVHDPTLHPQIQGRLQQLIG